MGMSRDENKTDIDLVNAQNKLSVIMTSINIEKVNLEDIQKELSDIKDKKDKAEKELSDIDYKVTLSEQNFLDIKESINSKISKLNESLIILENKNKEIISNLESDIKVLNIDLEKIKGQILITDNELKLKDASLSKLISDKNKELVILDSFINEKVKDKSNIEIEFNNIQKQLLSIDLITPQKELQEIDKELSIKNSELLETEKSIDLKKQALSSLDEKEKEKLFEIKDLSDKSNEIKKDLESQKQEKEDFIKAKIILQEDRQTLDQREEFIKEKYQIAGIKYS